jgi:predicted nucleotidyltransferase
MKTEYRWSCDQELRVAEGSRVARARQAGIEFSNPAGVRSESPSNPEWLSPDALLGVGDGPFVGDAPDGQRVRINVRDRWPVAAGWWTSVRPTYWTHDGPLTDSSIRYNGHMTELGLLADELGVHERTLRRAVGQGTLRATRPTPRTLELPLAERRYLRRAWPLLAALRRTLRTEQNVRFALLFGSATTGVDTRTSDVDVLVDLRDRSLERVVDLDAKLTAAVGRPVDLVRLEDARRDPAFLAAALSNGRVLIDRDQLWPRLRRRETTIRRHGRQLELKRTEAALAGIDRLIAN